MKTLIAYTLALLLTLVGPDPVLAAGEGTTKGLAGSVWSGKDSDGDLYVFTFERDGVLAYKSPSGTFKDGSWHVLNSAVYIALNDHYSEYLGEIDGDALVGKAWNKVGKNWTWKMTRQKDRHIEADSFFE